MISSDKIAMKCRRNGCNQDAVINHQYDRACSLYCRDVADVDEELAEARAEIERLTRNRNELYFLLLDIVADIEADPKGYDWPNLGRAQAALAEGE